MFKIQTIIFAADVLRSLYIFAKTLTSNALWTSRQSNQHDVEEAMIDDNHFSRVVHK
jgi:hypothetical protein